MNVFGKISNMKKVLEQNSIVLTDEQLLSIMRKLGNQWHYNKNKHKISLTTEEATIYEIFIINSINPATAYKWLLLAAAPEQIQMQLKTEEISQKQAFTQKQQFYHMQSTTDEEFMNAVADSIRRYLIR